ncbi:histidyl-tRNA synthetase [Jimgerdemannia flammicorona]|uniref:Histidyl-tRNA synthetase n=1 Tax=Jimgerdemannia flammicorona TaxID=994334 RepID=A0A433R0K1_9FUNG|nr:histidyl-tRNA synthetase [Jimgerdemannia flammicorona]
MVETANVLTAQIKEQDDKIHALKTQKADKHITDAEVLVHNDLKQQLVTLKASQLPTGDNAEKKKKKEWNGLFVLKAPKTKDYNNMEMAIREKVFSTITSVFKRHGAVTIDTPVFELKEILLGNYDEDRKLIYNLKDQGGEECSLRCDLSVPFVHFLAMNGKKYQNFKRYHITKVYRRDLPAMSKHKDFDIAGTYDPMEPDAEIFRILCEALMALDVGKYTVKLSWEDVRKELTEKGLSTESADAIGEYIKLKGGCDLLDQLMADHKPVVNSSAKKGLDDMALLFRYLEVQGVVNKMNHNWACYELAYDRAQSKHPTSKKDTDELDELTVGVGSIAAGGRYDELVGMFTGKNKNREVNLRIPCVSVSISVEHVFSIMLAKYRTEEIKTSEVQAFVVAASGGLLEERMAVAKELRDNEVKVSITVGGGGICIIYV